MNYIETKSSPNKTDIEARIKRGVRQDCGLPPVLFGNEGIPTKKHAWHKSRRKEFGKGIALIAENEEDLQKSTDLLNKILHNVK